MKTSRTLLIITLVATGATQSHAMWSRFAKPFTARFTTALKSGLLSKKALAVAAITGTSLSSYALQNGKTQTYPFASNGTLTIKNFTGHINVEGWDKEALEIKTLKTAFTQDSFDNTTTQLTVNGNHATIETLHNKPDNSPAHVRYIVKAPFKTRVEAKTAAGFINIKRILDVIAHTSNGYIKTKDCGSVVADTSNGYIKTTDCGNVVADTSNGYIKTTDCGNVVANSLNGRILIKGKSNSMGYAGGSVTIQDENGHVIINKKTGKYTYPEFTSI